MGDKDMMASNIKSEKLQKKRARLAVKMAICVCPPSCQAIKKSVLPSLKTHLPPPVPVSYTAVTSNNKI